MQYAHGGVAVVEPESELDGGGEALSLEKSGGKGADLGFGYSFWTANLADSSGGTESTTAESRLMHPLGRTTLLCRQWRPNPKTVAGK